MKATSFVRAIPLTEDAIRLRTEAIVESVRLNDCQLTLPCAVPPLCCDVGVSVGFLALGMAAPGNEVRHPRGEHERDDRDCEHRGDVGRDWHRGCSKG